MAYSYHRVALFGKKASQERLASRRSALLDITLNDGDGLPNLVCEVQAESLKFEEPHLGSEVTEGHAKSLAENPNFYYTPLYYPDKFTISSPNSTSHDTEESENSPESPHLGENACAVCTRHFSVCRARRGRG